MSDDTTPPKQNMSYSMGGSVSAGASMAPTSAGASFGGASAPAPATSQGASAGPLIKDVTTESFLDDVLEASKVAPVIVDFWAPWCGPCKQLGPVIEKAVTAANGAVTLAKMDIEKHPDVAGQMRIQSIPAVVAFVDGKPADAFMGAKPEREVKAFIDKIAAMNPNPPGADMNAVLDEADRLLKEEDYGGAADLYSSVLSQEPGSIDALAGIGHCYFAVGEHDKARDLVATIPPEHHTEGALGTLVKSLELAEQANDLGDIAALAEASEADPKNHQARYDYAIALNAHGRREDAVDQLVAIVKADRKWEDDGAREKLLEFFTAWGNSDPATVAGRRALSSVLFS